MEDVLVGSEDKRGEGCRGCHMQVSDLMGVGGELSESPG